VQNVYPYSWDGRLLPVNPPKLVTPPLP
jgi:hypothetical protein